MSDQSEPQFTFMQTTPSRRFELEAVTLELFFEWFHVEYISRPPLGDIINEYYDELTEESPENYISFDQYFALPLNNELMLLVWDPLSKFSAFFVLTKYRVELSEWATEFILYFHAYQRRVDRLIIDCFGSHEHSDLGIGYFIEWLQTAFDAKEVEAKGADEPLAKHYSDEIPSIKKYLNDFAYWKEVCQQAQSSGNISLYLKDKNIAPSSYYDAVKKYKLR